MSLSLLFAIPLIVFMLSLAPRNSKTFKRILGDLKSLLNPRITVSSPANGSPSTRSTVSQETSPSTSEVQSGTQALSRYQVESAYPAETWQRQTYDSFVATLVNTSSVFPCIYATKGFKADQQRFLFLGSDDLSSTSNTSAVAAALTDYLPQSRQLGANTSLVVLCKLSRHRRSVQGYHAMYWSFLRSLRALDTVPWPAEFPEEIDNNKWCFCFNGEPTFTVVQTPAHEKRQSRYAPSLRVVIQPKWIFDILFSTPKKRVGALKTIRELLRNYDGIPLSPDLKNYGDEGSRESEQYFLLDENKTANCPYEKLIA